MGRRARTSILIILGCSSYNKYITFPFPPPFGLRFRPAASPVSSADNHIRFCLFLFEMEDARVVVRGLIKWMGNLLNPTQKVLRSFKLKTGTFVFTSWRLVAF